MSSGNPQDLMDAITAANATGEADTIALSGTYALNGPDNFWYGPTGLPAISSTITIVGDATNGALITRAEGSPRTRFFYVSGGGSGLPAGDLTLMRLTLSGGAVEGGDSGVGGGGAGMGGAVFNHGTLALDAVTLSANTADGGDSFGPSVGLTAAGGGIGSAATRTAGGGFGGPAPGASGGSGGPSGGGAGAGGGGFGAADDGAPGAAPSGGAGGGTDTGLGGTGPSAGPAGNGAGGGGDRIAITGTGGAGGDFGFGGVDNRSGGGGGGVGGGGGTGGLGQESSASAGGGGGGFGGGGGSGIGDNGGGGGFGGGGGSGAGPAGYGAGAGGSSLQAGGGGAGMGGAVFNHGGTLTARNSTFSGNTASGGTVPASGGGGAGSGLGGAVFDLDGSVVLDASTLAGNTASAGGAVYAVGYGKAGAPSATVTLRNTIAADTTGGTDVTVDAPATVADGSATTASASLTYDGANLVEAWSTTGTATAGGTPTQTADPQLGPLADNGGPTETRAPAPTSPVVDAGSPPGLATDQRGVPRDDQPDIGSVELQVSDPCATALDLAGCWRFDEDGGTTAFDSSGNGNHGTYLNGPVLGQPGVYPDDTAVLMDGVDDAVRVPDAPTLDVGDSFTLEGWVKREDGSRTHQLFNKGDRSFHLLIMGASNGNQVWLRKANVHTVVRTATGVPADGAFHHVVATKDGPGSTQIYVDGVAQPLQQVNPASVIQDSSSPLHFSGVAANGNPIDGVADEFAIHDEALTADEVLARHRAGGGDGTGDGGDAGPARASTAGRSSRTATASRSFAGATTRCADVGGRTTGYTDVRVTGIPCVEATGIMRSGAGEFTTPLASCGIVSEDFRSIPRIGYRCTGPFGVRLEYTANG